MDVMKTNPIHKIVKLKTTLTNEAESDQMTSPDFPILVMQSSCHIYRKNFRKHICRKKVFGSKSRKMFFETSNSRLPPEDGSIWTQTLGDAFQTIPAISFLISEKIVRQKYLSEYFV